MVPETAVAAPEVGSAWVPSVVPSSKGETGVGSRVILSAAGSLLAAVLSFGSMVAHLREGRWRESTMRLEAQGALDR